MDNGSINDFRKTTAVMPTLREASSVSRFDSTTKDAFVQDLKTALQHVLAVHSTQKQGCGVISYHTANLQRVLASEIDWMNLMLHYDRQRAAAVAASTTRGETTNTTTTTPLDLVWQALTQNPTRFPVACHCLVFHVGWQQVINYCAKPRVASFRDDGDFLTRAQRFVWNALLSRMKRNHPGGAWAQYMTLPQVMDTQSTIVFRQCEALLRMLQEVRQHQQQPYLSAVVRTFLLDSSLRLLRQSEPFLTCIDNGSGNPETLVKRMKRKIKYNPFEASHDNDQDMPLDPDVVGLPKKPAMRESREASLPQILQQNTKVMLANSKGNTTLGDHEKWKEWRAQVFDFALSCTTPSLRKHESNDNLLDHIWSTILEEPEQSTLLRFFLVHILLSANSRILQAWMRSLLQLANSSGKLPTCLSAFALRCYSELVVELARFDDLELLQSITTPFFEHLLNDCTNDHDPTNLLKWKRAFVFILSRRTIFLDKIPHFASVKTTISLAWSSVEDWVNPGMSPKEQSHTVTTLYQAGILGVCEAMEYQVDSNTNSPKQANAQLWPFDELHGVRMAARHCGKLYQSRHIFSRSVPRLKAQKSDPAEIGDFAQNFLHGDVLLRIFEYLGFKRMAQVHLVCREWNESADHPRLWQCFYETRYGIAEEDPVRSSPDQPWKTYFHHRFIVEKEVRSRASRSAKKLRVCQFVGCNTIVSTPLQLTRHHDSHQKKTRNKVKKPPAENKPAERKRKQAAPKSARKKPQPCRLPTEEAIKS